MLNNCLIVKQKFIAVLKFCPLFWGGNQDSHAVTSGDSRRLANVAIVTVKNTNCSLVQIEFGEEILTATS